MKFPKNEKGCQNSVLKWATVNALIRGAAGRQDSGTIQLFALTQNNLK